MKIKKIISLIAVMTLVFSMCACGKATGDDKASQKPSADLLKLSFKAASSYDYLKKNDGCTVSINGYMATSSPADGSFIFLMNLPYQSCPFCVPNTSALANTIECYPQKGRTFDYTNQAVKVTGTLVVSEREDKNFKDMYGYEFNFKIEDADYTIISAEELGEDMALWQALAQTDVITEVYNMYNFVSFVCSWNTYYVKPFTDEEGKKHNGFYLYASDAENYLYDEEGQYHYGMADGYFDGIVSTIEKVDPEAFSDLVENVRKAEVLAEKAIKELKDGNYTSTYQHVDMFDTQDYVYTINKGDELAAEMDAIYVEFSSWLSNWEM